ncbi:MAG: HD domain-containing protein [Candidatus Cloacimonetes bacterium]|nr:HD domain-containing protein [Candidatus Cloacimonadota bacterium]
MENQIEIFVLISSAFLGIFILLTVYLIIKLKINDILLQKSEKQLQKITDSLQQLVDSQTEDIRKSEKKIRQLYKFNKEVLDHSPAAIIKLDPKLDIEFFNPEARKLITNNAKELINIREFTGIKKTSLDYFLNKLENQKEVSAEFSMKVNEEERYFSINGVPLIENNLFNGAVLLINDTTQSIKAQKNMKKSFRMLKKATENIIMAMANTSEMRDPYTAGHQKRVRSLALAISKEMTVTSEQLEGIKFAGIIHDIGKVAVPSDILAKPGNITKVEFEVIKSHSAVGYNLLNKIEFPWPIAEIVHQHHEKLDGSGYPNGLKGNQILLEAQILTVADIVEAMVSHRPYRAALGTEIALSTIKNQRGTLLNAEIVDTCVKLFEEKNFTFEMSG